MNKFEATAIALGIEPIEEPGVKPSSGHLKTLIRQAFAAAGDLQFFFEWAIL